MKNIWGKLAEEKPFFVSAPMAGVSDIVFRQMLVKYGRPDVIFTEFVSTENIARSTVGAGLAPAQRGQPQGLPLRGIMRKNLPDVLWFEKNEHPIVVQFFGSKPEQFEQCAKLIVGNGRDRSLRFDGIDINMGCPDRKVQKQGAGSELIKNPKLAVEIIRATKEGCSGRLPVSVKTRIGYSKKDFTHITAIAKEGVDAITIHGRTVKQGYGGAADWEAIGEAVKIIKKINPKIIIIGNGDVKDSCRGALLCAQHGVDGIMIGRALVGNPWCFRRGLINQTPTIKERLKAAYEHTLLFEKYFQSRIITNFAPRRTRSSQILPNSIKHFDMIKKHYAGYMRGFDGAKEIRTRLMNVKNLKEAKSILKEPII